MYSPAMGHPWTTRGLKLPQNEHVETEKCDPFLYFAKRSREVQRQNEERVFFSPPVLHRSSLITCEEPQPGENLCFTTSCDNPLNLVSRAAGVLVSGRAGAGGAGIHLEKLPSPAELMGRRRKKRRGGATQRWATSVTQHIGDLRRKQSIIEEMKRRRWTSEHGCLSGEVDPAQTGHENPVEDNPNLDVSLPAHGLHALHTPLCLNTDLVSQQHLMDVAPGSNPMMSFVVKGTAHRGVQRSLERPGLSHSQLWGVNYRIEE